MANSWQQPNDAEQGGGQWHKFENPSQGAIASKTGGWTADRFTTASGGMAVDFSSVVLAGTRAVRVQINQSGTQGQIYVRKAGDTEISNTPNASSEISHRIMAADDDIDVAVGWLSTDNRIEIAVTNTDQDIKVAYPIEYML